MKFGQLILGIFVIFLGVLLLGVNFSWWGTSVWIDLFDLWPLILILFGVRLIFGPESLVTIIAIIFSIIFATLYLANFKQVRSRLPFSNSSVENISGKQNFSQYVDGINKIEMRINLGAAKINVDALSGSGRIYNGNFSGKEELAIQNSVEGSIGKTTFEEKPGFHFGKDKERTLNLEISQNLPLDLEINTGASTLDLDFSKIDLQKLNIDSGATKGKIRFGLIEKKIDAIISTGASDYKLMIPKSFAISVSSDSALTGNNFESVGLIKQGKFYKSPNYEQSENQIMIKLSSGASKFEIERD